LEEPKNRSITATEPAAQVRAVRARLAADVAMLAEIPRPVIDLSTLTVSELEVDRSSRTVTLAGEPVKVTNREFELVALLASDPTRVFGKRELLREVWGARLRADRHPHRRQPRLPPAHQARRRAVAAEQLGRRLQLTPPAAALRAA
jgi:DNA-binding response OmpR family regulator